MIYLYKLVYYYENFTFSPLGVTVEYYGVVLYPVYITTYLGYNKLAW